MQILVARPSLVEMNAFSFCQKYVYTKDEDKYDSIFRKKYKELLPIKLLGTDLRLGSLPPDLDLQTKLCN